MRSLSVRFALAIFAVAVAVILTMVALLQLLYVGRLDQRYAGSLALIERFVRHPGFEAAREALPEDLARDLAELRRQMTGTLDLIVFVRERRWLFAFGFFALLAPLIVGLALFVSRRLTRPLETVAEAARRLARGDYAARAQVRPGSWDSESLALAKDFNAMAASLERFNDERRGMIADIAHELRTPLTAIQLQLEAAQDGIDPLNPALIDRLATEVALLSRLVVDLRTLSLAEAGQVTLDLVEIDLGVFLENVRSWFDARADAKGITLRLRASHGVTLRADAERLRQIVGNYLDNALRHTPSGGEVTLEVEHDPTWVTIAVLDTGPGLNEETLSRAFDRFYRSGTGRIRAEGGSGLGLAIARALAELHGGHVAVRNRAEGGARFTVTLPTGLERSAGGLQAILVVADRGA